jgi:cytochrome d ubiquinol oxidase subunit II
MAILFCFVIQAVSYEYRSKPGNFLGRKSYETFLFINGAIGTILIGTAVATFFTGSQFSVNDMNSSRWEVASHGLEAALNLHNLSLGLTIFFLARVLGLLYFINNINHKPLVDRIYKQLWFNVLPFLFFFLTFLIWLLIRDGFAYDPLTKVVSMEPFKYLNNLLAMPTVLIILLLGILLVLYGLFMTLFKAATKGIWFTGIGTILTVFALFLTAGFNNTAFYPSTFDLQSSLTIENSSSSHYTLTAMSYVSLFVPFVFAYIYFAWKAIDKTKITEEELNNETHKY